MARSAGPISEKRSILVQECLRRLKNCDPGQPWNVKTFYLNKFMLEMKFAGHNQKFRQTVAEIAIKKYQNILKKHNEKEGTMYSNRSEQEEMVRQKEGNASKYNWFREKGGYTSTVNVLPTPNSNLADRIRTTLEVCPAPKGTRT
jgi:hypothetical protein